MQVQNWLSEVVAVADAKRAELVKAHPTAYGAGHTVGVKDRNRYNADPEGYEDDTNPPAHLTGDALKAWYAGWEDANEL